jgi:5-methylcytosine-specific restriction endonuclease McrA
MDFFIYQLVSIQKSVIRAMEDARKNAEKYLSYQKELKAVLSFGVYDTDRVLRNRDKLQKMEKRMIYDLIQHPTISVNATVCLRLTNMQGVRKASKQDVFQEKQIKRLIERINEKSNGRYNDEEIWKSICRVERGRVTNKVRFAIYHRDNYRCKNCGKAAKNLEIDHIYPISRGGKSNYNNLQTLCRECNELKSNRVVGLSPFSTNTHQKVKECCPHCSVPLVLREGRYGKFYGCVNYPNCKYTKKFIE